MATNYEGAAQGALSGAGIGASFGPMGAGIGAGVGALGGLMGLFGKKRKTPKFTAPDISGELAKLDALYAQQGELLRGGIQQQIGKAQAQTAQNLANRGIFSSPVSQKALNEVQKQGLLALAQGQAGLLGSQAQARTSALNNLLQYQQAAQRANAEMALQKYLGQAQARRGLIGAGIGGLTQLIPGYKKQPKSSGGIDSSTTDALSQYFGGVSGLGLY